MQTLPKRSMYNLLVTCFWQEELLALMARQKQLWSQFLLEVKHSIHLVGRALSNCTILEQWCFFQIFFAYICKPTYKFIHAQDTLTSQSRSGRYLLFRCPRHFIHSSHLHPTAFHEATAARVIYSNQAILTTFQTMCWSTTSFSTLFYFSHPKKLFINKGAFYSRIFFFI